MSRYIESETIELKEKYTDTITKEIVYFLNSSGGSIIVGVKDNGAVVGVYKIEGQKPFPASSMSLALGGSFLGSCFIQKEPFYTAQNVGILQEKEPLSTHTKLFIWTMIRNMSAK